MIARSTETMSLDDALSDLPRMHAEELEAHVRNKGVAGVHIWVLHREGAAYSLFPGESEEDMAPADIGETSLEELGTVKKLVE
ncbi:MAG: hypothetical protein AAF555_05605 [Verrucomicrobiota bacterium]